MRGSVFAAAGILLCVLLFNYCAFLFLLPKPLPPQPPSSPLCSVPSSSASPPPPPPQQQQNNNKKCAATSSTATLPEEGDVLHVVSHTHWDREWYLPQELLRAKLLRTIDEALTRSETTPAFAQFLVDGQAQPLLDYVEVRPEDAERLAHALECETLRAGPWLTQPDEFLSTGECLVRNLLHGTSQMRKLAPGSERPWLRVGYLPDAFGHAGQVPQLLAGFNISAAAFARGAPPETPAEAVWRAPDGSEVLAVVQKGFYCNSGGTPDTGSRADAALWFATRRVWGKRHSATRHMLLMNGCDHTGFDPNVLENIQLVSNTGETSPLGLKGASVQHSSLERYIAAVLAEVSLTSLPVLSGELREDISGLSSVLSARPRQKQMMWACSHLLQRWAEPAVSLALALSNESSMHRSIFSGRIRQAWTLLLETMPHDSSAGCVVDRVANEVSQRLERCIQISAQVAGEALREISQHIDTSSIKQQYDALALAFNPLPFALGPSLVVVELDIVEEKLVGLGRALAATVVECATGASVPAAIVRDFGSIPDYTLPDFEFRKLYTVRRVHVAFEPPSLPALGFSTFGVSFGSALEPASKEEQEESNPQATCAEPTDKVLGTFGNTELSVEILHDCSVLLRRSEECFGPALKLSYEEEFGDAYNHGDSGNIPITSNTNGTVEIRNNGPLCTTALCRTKLGRRTYRVNYVLPSGSRALLALVEETAEDATPHRLRAQFDFSAGARFFSDGQFDLVERKPSASEPQPFESIVAMKSASGSGLVIGARGLHEHEILESADRSTAFLTLARTADHLTDWAVFQTNTLLEADIAHSFEMAIVPAHRGNEDFESALQAARQFASPAVAFHLRRYTGVLTSHPIVNPLDETELKRCAGADRPPLFDPSPTPAPAKPYVGLYDEPRAPLLGVQESFLDLGVSSLQIDALKIPELRSTGTVLRFHNPSSATVQTTASISALSSSPSASLCSLDESQCRPIATTRKNSRLSFNLTVPPKKIVTMALHL